MSNFPAPTSFINVLVFVTPTTDPQQPFSVVTVPPAPTITATDTVISYQIFDTDGYDIVFTGATVEPVNDQLSPASVSVSGKLLTFSDANTLKVDLNVTLQFKDLNKPEVTFLHDPQIINSPETGRV